MQLLQESNLRNRLSSRLSECLAFVFQCIFVIYSDGKSEVLKCELTYSPSWTMLRREDSYRRTVVYTTIVTTCVRGYVVGVIVY